MLATTLRVGMLMMLAAGMASACSSDDDPPAAPATQPSTAGAPGSAIDLMGRTFISTAVEGEQIPGGGPLTLTFADGRISTYAGCNTASGSVDVTGNVLRVSQLASTLIGCPGDRGSADGWQDRLLSGAPAWQLDNATKTLTLTGKDITVRLLDKKLAQPDKPLTGTTWTVTSLLSPQAQTSSQTIDQVKPTLVIAADGAVSGTAGCNRMMGTATIAPEPNGPDVTFQVGTTKMLCDPEVMEVERAVLTALDGPTLATIDADTLTLRNKNGNGLVLRAQ